MNSRNREHEEYLKRACLNKMLENSLTSQSPSKQTIERSLKTGDVFFKKLKEGLMNKYQNQKLIDLPGAKHFENEYGQGLKIIKTDNKRKLQIKDNTDKIYENLKIIQGIGEKTEIKLKEKGYTNIQTLLKHDKYKIKAEKTLKQLESNDINTKINLIKQTKNKTDLLNISSKIPEENFKFMDIETLGLTNTHIILIGIAEVKNKKIISTQYFLQDYHEEATILYEYFKHLNEDSIYVTFNGKCFDVPFIDTRSRLYRLKQPKLINYDLMYYARKIWGEKLPNCKLQTIESEIFDFHRIDDVPGQYIPGYWKTYKETGNIGPIIPIIKHNRIDIVNLACFLNKLIEDNI